MLHSVKCVLVHFVSATCHSTALGEEQPKQYMSDLYLWAQQWSPYFECSAHHMPVIVRVLCLPYPRNYSCLQLIAEEAQALD